MRLLVLLGGRRQVLRREGSLLPGWTVPVGTTARGRDVNRDHTHARTPRALRGEQNASSRPKEGGISRSRAPGRRLPRRNWSGKHPSRWRRSVRARSRSNWSTGRRGKEGLVRRDKVLLGTGRERRRVEAIVLLGLEARIGDATVGTAVLV